MRDTAHVPREKGCHPDIMPAKLSFMKRWNTDLPRQTETEKLVTTRPALQKMLKDELHTDTDTDTAVAVEEGEGRRAPSKRTKEIQSKQSEPSWKNGRATSLLLKPP